MQYCLLTVKSMAVGSHSAMENVLLPNSDKLINTDNRALMLWIRR